MAIPIPGLKIVDDILAGMPDNARYRRELTELRAQMRALAAENSDLKKKIKQLTPASGLDPKAAEVLKLFFEQDERAAHQVQGALGLAAGMAEHHIGTLRKYKYVLPSRARVHGHIQTNYYRITQAGRDFAVELGLV